jgi:hypothetical protein
MLVRRIRALTQPKPKTSRQICGREPATSSIVKRYRNSLLPENQGSIRFVATRLPEQARETRYATSTASAMDDSNMLARHVLNETAESLAHCLRGGEGELNHSLHTTFSTRASRRASLRTAMIEEKRSCSAVIFTNARQSDTYYLLSSMQDIALLCPRSP